MKNWKMWLSRAGTVLLILFASLVFYRMFVLEREGQTADAVAKIHATKLTLDDVMGTNLPAKPANPDATIQGVDANKNGIRDDVELAIFETYPKSAKTRAVLLQYALALQMEVTQGLVNSGTVGEVANQESRGYLCIGKTISRVDLNNYVLEGNKLRKFVRDIQLNTADRKNAQQAFFKKLGSGTVPNEDPCDIDLSTLKN